MKLTEQDVGVMMKFRSELAINRKAIMNKHQKNSEVVNWFLDSMFKQDLLMVICFFASKGRGFETNTLYDVIAGAGEYSDGHVQRVINEGVKRGYLIKYQKPEDKRVTMFKIAEDIQLEIFALFDEITTTEFALWFTYIGSSASGAGKVNLARGTVKVASKSNGDFLDTLQGWDSFGDIFYREVNKFMKIDIDDNEELVKN